MSPSCLVKNLLVYCSLSHKDEINAHFCDCINDRINQKTFHRSSLLATKYVKELKTKVLSLNSKTNSVTMVRALKPIEYMAPTSVRGP